MRRYERQTTAYGVSSKTDNATSSIDVSLKRFTSTINKEFENIIGGEICDEISLIDRLDSVKRLAAVVHVMWPECAVRTFGSTSTRLCSSDSDLDISVRGSWSTLPYRTLQLALLKSSMYDDVVYVQSNIAPIVKATDRRTGVKMDLTLNGQLELSSVSLVLHYRFMYSPHLEHLVLYVKRFLKRRNLNRLYTGGLSSYALVLMVINYLQTKQSTLSTDTFSTLLCFFRYYGLEFDYSSLAVCVRKGAPIKKEFCKFKTPDCYIKFRESPLYIEDPLNINNNVSRGSFCWFTIRQAFAYAYFVLKVSVDRRDVSALGHLLYGERT